MAIRLQEVHPSVVQFPLALLRLAVGTDALGRLTGDEKLLWLGKRGIAAAVAAGTVAGLTGLVGQDLRAGVKHLVNETAEGKLVPSMTG